jgi:ribosome-binding protein aMBF1 (putative translation factor)
MKRKLQHTIRKALERASVSEGQLSQEAGYHPTSLSRIKIGARDATPDAAQALAEALRARAKLLERLADDLEGAAGAEEGG